MRKLLLSICILFTATLGFAQSPKGKLAEGVVTYTVKWNLPEQMQPMAAQFPTELKVYFKGDSASLKTESAMYSSTNIINSAKEYERLLLDIPMMGKKFSVIFTPADLDKMAEQMPDIQVKAGTETKVVAGYNATKHEVHEKKTDHKSEAWFTKDVDVTANPLTRYYDKNLGFPVEFTSYLSGVSVNAVIKEIQAITVPAGVFSASKDYEEITFDQLMQMQQGR